MDKMDDIKLLKQKYNIPWWKVADHIGVCEMTIYRWIRKYDPKHHEIIKNAINRLAEESRADKKELPDNRWTPMSKKKPKPHHEYIVTIEGATTKSTRLFWDGEYWYDEHWSPYSVIAWMPFPEVYKEDE